MWRCSEPILLWRCSFSHHYVALFWAYSLVTLFILSPLCGAVLRIFSCDVVHSLTTMWRCSEPILWWRRSFSHHYVALFWGYSLVTLFILSPLCGAVLSLFSCDFFHSLTTNCVAVLRFFPQMCPYQSQIIFAFYNLLMITATVVNLLIIFHTFILCDIQERVLAFCQYTISTSKL